MRLSRIIGFLVLLAFVIVLFTTTLINVAQHNLIFLVVLLFFALGCLYAIYHVFKEEVYKQEKVTLNKNSLMQFIAVFVGAFLTYGLHVLLGCPVLSAGIIGLLAALFIKPLQVPIYTGAFVGMSSALLFGFWQFALASVLASLLFIIVTAIFNGFGGKLGTIALSGATISTLIARNQFNEGTEYIASEQLWIIVLSTLAAVITYIISIRLKRGPVFASAIVGVLAGATFPFILPEMGGTYSVVIIGASFVGMSSQVRFKDETPIIIAGLLFGLIFVYSAPYFSGAGGKLGTIAFVSVLSVKGIMLFVLKLAKRNIEPC